MNKTVLVTGGAGFIGSHTCLLLLERGYRVVVLDSYINSSSISLNRVLFLLERKGIFSAKDNLKIFEGDIRDKKILNKIFLEYEQINSPIDSVIHFAGLKSITESFENPLSYWHVNVVGSLNLFEIMKKFKCQNIVFSSSAMVYFQSNSLLSEVSKILPINPYGKTKAAVETILEDISESKSFNWKVINLRYFNPCGAHPSGLIGENSKGIQNNLFPILCKVAFGKQKILKIYGNNWDTKDGTCVRDYIHVMDLAESHIKALEFLYKKDKIFLALNVGTGVGTSVLDFVNTFEKSNQCKLKYVFTSPREGDNSQLVANVELINSTLNWKAKFSLEDICKHGWNWFTKNPEGFVD